MIVRDDVDKTGFLVSEDGVRDVPQDVCVDVVVAEGVVSGEPAVRGVDSLVRESVVADADCDRGGEPFAEGGVDGEALGGEGAVVEDSVDTRSCADEQVVERAVRVVGLVVGSFCGSDDGSGDGRDGDDEMFHFIVFLDVNSLSDFLHFVGKSE